MEANGMIGRYRISYGDLVPISLFIDGDKTSLYTLWEESDEFRRQAGFIEHEAGGMVAIEFTGTKFSDALMFLDLCADCETESRPDIADSLNTHSETPMPMPPTFSYINTDIDADYLATIDSNSADVEGQIYRVYWSGISGELLVTNVTEIDPFAYISSTKTLEPTACSSLRKGNRVKCEEASGLGDVRLHDAFFLFQTLSLLRAARDQSIDNWHVFMEALGSPTLVNNNPHPWELYTVGVREVYPEISQ